MLLNLFLIILKPTFDILGKTFKILKNKNVRYWELWKFEIWPKLKNQNWTAKSRFQLFWKFSKSVWFELGFFVTFWFEWFWFRNRRFHGSIRFGLKRFGFYTLKLIWAKLNHYGLLTTHTRCRVIRVWLISS